MLVPLSHDNQAVLADCVTMRLRHDLQKLYLQGSHVNLGAAATPQELPAQVVMEAQDLAVKSLVVSLTVGGQVFTSPKDDLLEKIFDLPAADGQAIYDAVNQLLTASNQPVPKV